MRASTLLTSALVGLTSLSVACSSESGESPAGSESDLTLRAYEYTCTSGDAFILEDAATMKVVVTNGLLRFTDGYGENIGERDNTYRPPSGTQRARYRGYEYGGDCSLKLVIDEGAIGGAETAQLRVQCEGDDNFQDLYTCGSPRRTSLEIADPAPITPPAPTGPAADAKKWSCTTSQGYELGTKVTLQLDENAMRIYSEDSELDYDGARDREYQPRSGSYIRYDGFEYGGDCSLSAVVEDKALTSGTSEVTLKVRCAGDDFNQDVYRCTAP